MHVVMPAMAVDRKTGRCHSPNSRHKKICYLFNHKALAKVFRAKLLAGMQQAGLVLPKRYPKAWVVDCKSVGSGEKALVYLGRYLYKGVLQEKHIISCKDGRVTFRYQASKTQQWQTRTLPGAQFLRLILQHVLPKGFRRTRNFGFLHANSKRLWRLLESLLLQNPVKVMRVLVKKPPILCPCCGSPMRIVRTRMPRSSFELLVPSD